MELIHKYFPGFTSDQFEKFALLSAVYTEWNQKINVISRKDMPYLYERHILHSLAIARFIRFKPGSRIVDIGTGGGFPGIPLAIAFPESEFVLVDSISKKVRVVNEVANFTGLKNVTTKTDRAEHLNISCDFVVSRAVSALPDFYKNTLHIIRKNSSGIVHGGILYLKGGDFNEELKPIPHEISVQAISDYYEEPFFETKKIVYINCSKNK